MKFKVGDIIKNNYDSRLRIIITNSIIYKIGRLNDNELHKFEFDKEYIEDNYHLYTSILRKDNE